MTQVTVITGGGSGMGLEAAKLLPAGEHVIITGRTVAKLKDALVALEAAGVDAEAFACDVGEPDRVAALVRHAASAGTVKRVIHAAGVSAGTADATSIFTTNAIGTIYVNEQFAAVMREGGAILNVASMAAHMLPAGRVPRQLWATGAEDVHTLVDGFQQILNTVPADQAADTAYALSKSFVVWYTAHEAVKYGPAGIRVASISPGTFATPMGEAEGERAAAFARSGPLGRVGDPVEIARMMAFLVTEATYLTGADVLYDGGVVASLAARAEAAAQARVNDTDV